MLIYDVVLTSRATGDDVKTILVTSNVDEAADKAWEYNLERYNMENVDNYMDLMYKNDGTDDNPSEPFFADYYEKEV